VIELLDVDGETCARVNIVAANQFGDQKIVGEAVVALAA
jgi:hypothetical protein